MKPFLLPKGFLLGSATSATQIEGGDRNNDWFEWCRKGKIGDGSSSLRADDHWNRFPEDVALLKELSQQVYRMGIEWSRIEPEEGFFNDAAMAHYRSELKLLVHNGIRPLVTLHHFTLPLWVSHKGGFENPKIVDWFERYVRYVVSKIGDLVSEYVTINEPNVYVSKGYFYGLWPPGNRDLKLVPLVYRNMSRCHFAAYRAIHGMRSGFPGKTMVGVAHHLRVFTPQNRLNPLDRLACGTMQYLFQGGIVKLMTTGHLVFPAELLKENCCDFMGINYYSRSTVRFCGWEDGAAFGAPKNDLGWEIYPDGIRALSEKYYRKYRLPIWITENGTCDSRDAFRPEYLCSHLEKIAEAAQNGARVERYYHWSLLDNFEWLEGESARFGLVHVDFETQRRTVKKSGRLYGEICRSGGLTREMICRYFPQPEA